MGHMRLFLGGAATLIGLLFLGGSAATPVDASIIEVEVDQILVEIDGNDYSALSVSVWATFTSPVLTIEVTNNTSEKTTGPTASENAGNLLTGLGFNLPSGVDIVDTSGSDSSVSLYDLLGLKESKVVNKPLPFTQDAWGYGNSASGHLTDLGVLPVDTTLSSLSADASTTFAGSHHSALHGIGFGLQSLGGNAGPGGQPAIKDHVTFTLHLTGLNDFYKLDDNLIDFINDNPVVAVFGSPSSPIPEPASFVVWFLIGISWVGSAWTHQYRRRWKKWQQEEAAAAAGSHGDDQSARLPADQAEAQVGGQSAGSTAAG